MTVPIVPGVPALLAGVGVMVLPPTLLTSDSTSVVAQAENVIWGIFDTDGNAVITGDSVRAFDFRNASDVSDYPIEEGGFESYNKVATPYDTRITFVQGGNVDERASFLTDLKSTLDDLNLYTVVTPEIQYQSANVINIQFRRTAREGVTLLSVEVWVREIRQNASIAFSNTAAPDGADEKDDGQIPPRKPVKQTNTPATEGTPATATSPAVPPSSGTISGTLSDDTVVLPNSPAAQIQMNTPSFITIGQSTPAPVNLAGPPPDGNPLNLPPNFAPCL